MSEKIYAFLFGLYPAQFRKQYGEAALQLFRDRQRDERGVRARLRLWKDLAFDLLVSLPREYRHSRLVLASAPAASNGIPVFGLLEEERPRAGALFSGGVLSLVFLYVCTILLSHPGTIRRIHSSQAFTPSTSAQAGWRGKSPASGDGNTLAIGNGESAQTGAVESTDAQAKAVQIIPSVLDAGEKKLVIDTVASNIQKYYFDREMGPKIAEMLLLHNKKGEDGVADPRTLAALLTLQAWQAGGDHKLVVRYSATPLPEESTSKTAEAQARHRQTVLQSNCLLQSVNILPHNIGYLKLNGFPELDVCQPDIERAMSSLNGVSALIVDLRDNMGGQPEMVAFLASYFFNRPTYLYNPQGGSQKAFSTQSPIAGNRLADKPVYLLTSHLTTSTAEQFCYNLKKLKRATLVGEITNGSMHSGTWHRIDAHFGMGIPETKVVNPYGEFDWEGFGVGPDIKVNAADALEVATKLAEKSLR